MSELRGRRVVLGVSGASPRTRRSTCAVAWSTPARTSCRCSPPTRCGSSARSRSRRWRRNRRARASSPEPNRSRTRASARRPISSWSRRPPRSCSGSTRRGSPTTSSPPRSSRRAHRSSSRPRCTPRCGSTPRYRRTSPRSAARGVHVVDPESGSARGRRRRGGSPRRPRADRRGRRAGARRWASDLAGVRVLVTAGGTREPIDAVRVITNRSSGKQGYAVAEVAAQRGARGHLRHHHRPAGADAGVRSCPCRPPPRCRTRSWHAAPSRTSS